MNENKLIPKPEIETNFWSYQTGYCITLGENISGHNSMQPEDFFNAIKSDPAELFKVIRFIN